MYLYIVLEDFNKCEPFSIQIHLSHDGHKHRHA